MQHCDKCGRAIPVGGLFYDLAITLDQGFDGVIAGEQGGDLPGPRCREKFAANPLDLPLDARDIPRSFKDIEE
jgi:hypothetical protein